MGDIPYASNTGADHVDSSLETDGIGGGALRNEPQHPSFEHGFTGKTQQHPSATQHAFATQIDMTQSSADGRSGPYNMGSMSNSLPQVGYRPGQYPHASPQRYNTGSSPSMMQQMPQYTGHPTMPMAGQGYYIQQPQMAQYYSGQLSPTPAAASMPSRQNMSYYPNQMMMNHPQSAYYYPPAPQYPASGHHLSNPLMAGQFANQTPVSNDPRTMVPSLGNDRIQQSAKDGPGTQRKESYLNKANSVLDGIDRRQNAVRGPPRKPRQSGEISYLNFDDPTLTWLNVFQDMLFGLETFLHKPTS